MDHAAGGQEQARLEEGVGIEVEDGDAVSADAQRDEHEAELRDGRVREHLLDVGLHDRDRRREKRREHADRGDDGAGLRRMQIDAGQAGDQIHAGGHHRRRMNQRGDRRRSRHRVGQPDMQRYLRRLAGGADEQQDADQARRHGGNRPAHERAIDAVHVQRAERLVEHEHAQQEAGVADAVGDEGLLARARLVGVLEPEADQQIRREPHAFPSDEQDQQRPAQHEQSA